MNINTTVTHMADTLEEHSMIIGGVNHLSETGWELLSEEFGSVPMELRASVMNDFMKLLTKRGIEFDVSEFQEKPSA